jgi:hypothetical protein
MKKIHGFMKPDSFQMHQHKTNRLTPDYRRLQTANPYHRGHYSHVCISCDNSGYRQILITNFQQSDGFLRAMKVCSTPSIGWEVKPEVPCRKILRHVKDHLKSHGDE